MLFMGCCNRDSKPGKIWERIESLLEEARRVKNDEPEKWDCTEAGILDRFIALDDVLAGLCATQMPTPNVEQHLEAKVRATHSMGKLMTDLIDDFGLNESPMDYKSYGKPIEGAKPEDYAVGEPTDDWF